MASFDFIAYYYDFLSELVFGQNLNRAKKHFLYNCSSDSKILLMGGGTGAILNELLQLLPKTTIDYVEPSAKMISIAKKKLKSELSTRINFICGNHLSIPTDRKYDVVTSFFVMDCLKQKDASQFSRTVTGHLKESGVWLFADFYGERNILHKALIWLMYRFFNITARIQATVLPDFELLFSELNFQCKEEQHFLSGLIRSKVLIRKLQ